MGSNISVINKTNLSLDISFSIGIDHYWETRVMPNERIIKRTGKAWYTVNAKLWDPRNEISSNLEDLVGIIEIFQVTLNAFLSSPISSAINVIVKRIVNDVEMWNADNNSYQVSNDDGEKTIWTTTLYNGETAMRSGWLFRVGDNSFVSTDKDIVVSTLNNWLKSAIYSPGWSFHKPKTFSITGGPNSKVVVALGTDAVEAFTLDNNYPTFRLDNARNN